MVERRVLSGANRSGFMGGPPQEGRSGPSCGSSRKAEDGNCSSEGRSSGTAFTAAHASEAPQRAEVPEAQSTAGETVAPALSDFAQTIERTGDLKSKCPGCGGREIRILFRATDRLYHTTDKIFSIVECNACRLIRLDPRPSQEELADYYPESYWYAPDHSFASRLEQGYRRFVVRDHVRFVSRAIRESGERGMVLDVGCGGGLLLSMLREEGTPVLGLETSRRAADVAWHHNHIPVICGDLADSPVLNESCSAVTMFHVIEHLYEPGAYLRSALALLRRNGRLIVQVPNASSWQFLLFGDRWNGIDVPRHLVNYRQRDIESLIETSGFEILRRKHFSLRDNTAGFATSIAPDLDPMARRVRRLRESGGMKAIKDLLYLGLVAGSLPFTWFEAACGAGSTIMIEARKKP